MSAAIGLTHIERRLSSITALLRLSVIQRVGAAQSSSDQSVYDTDTEVPSIDEPLPSVQVQSDNVEFVVSEASSAEASLSDILYVTSGDRFEQLASSLLSQMRELSDRGLHPPVQSHSILGSSSRPIVAATDYFGVSALPQGVHLSNPVDPVFRLSTAPVSDETPARLVASDRKVQALEKDITATRQAVVSLCDRGLTPPQSLLDSLSSLSRELNDAKRTSSELCGAIRPPSSQPGVSSHRHSPLLRLSSQVLRNQKATLHSLVHHFLGDDSTISLHRVRLDVLFARGVTLPPTRGVGSQTMIHLTTSVNRLQVANNRTMTRPTRRIFVLLLWRSYLTTS